jgi:hypothetical protein
MRHSFQTQPNLQITPIEKIRLPLQSRDELPPILAGLQWLWMHPTLKAEIFALLEVKILAGKKATGRTGMDLWQILVLGVVRLGLDADWDRMADLANHHLLIRQMLGLPAVPWGDETKSFGHQTLRDNVALLDDELLGQINARIAAAGREVFAKKGGAPLAALEVKVDTYVLETDVHFPTDLNLLWDAGRKCVDLIATDQHQLIQDYDVPASQADVDQSVPVADRLLGRYGVGQIASLSFDKGFTRAQDRDLLSLYVPEVVMPKRGKKTAAETERESGKKFVALRRAHSAVESDINSLEHHGLNRCLDVGWQGYLRYVGYGVMSYNLHQIGRELLARARADAVQWAA